MLRMALNVPWSIKMSNKELYGNMIPVSKKVAYRRMKLAGHCVRHPEEVASTLVLWQPTTGRRNRGRQAVTFIDTLFQDTELRRVQTN